jgi:hypothetical protein
MDRDPLPAHFIDQPITVSYDRPPLLSKKPDCPDGFTWQGRDFRITSMLSEWVDYERRGRMARNMMPIHAQTASLRGSWGVGRFFFRVETEDARVFDIYYDRAPKDSSDREGAWFVLCERE